MFPRDASSTRFAKPSSIFLLSPSPSRVTTSKPPINSQERLIDVPAPRYRIFVITAWKIILSGGYSASRIAHFAISELSSEKRLLFFAIIDTARVIFAPCMRARRRRLLTMYLTFLAFIIIGTGLCRIPIIFAPRVFAKMCSLPFFLFSFRHIHISSRGGIFPSGYLLHDSFDSSAMYRGFRICFSVLAD